MKKNIKENIAKWVFFSCALITVISLLIIMIFIFGKGIPAIAQIGFTDFLFGVKWNPSKGYYGILPMIMGSIGVTALSFLVGSFIGKWCAIFLAYYCKGKVYKILKSMVELLAGIPSVIYGFFGVITIVPFIRDNFGGPGKSMLAAVVILSIMILPTIINISETSIKAVPQNYYEGAVALGATHNEAVFNVVVPAAKSGIYTSYILGIGRAFGETMAIILVSGNSPNIPSDILNPVRTLTAGIATEMGYATGLHQSALFGIGVVLFIFIFILNIILNSFIKKENK